MISHPWGQVGTEKNPRENQTSVKLCTQNWWKPTVKYKQFLRNERKMGIY